MAKKLTKRLKAITREDKAYTPQEAVDFIKQATAPKFDQTVDIAVCLNLKSGKTEETVRGVVSLPKGSGKTVKVAVFATGEGAAAAKKAGADIVGAEELVAEVAGGKVDFDKCVAMPELMPKVGTLGKVLGPKGIMPNPKLGTVTADVANAVANLKGGQVEFRAEKNGVVHGILGKVSFAGDDILANLKAFYEAIKGARPEAIKDYIKAVHLGATMIPSVRVDHLKISG